MSVYNPLFGHRASDTQGCTWAGVARDFIDHKTSMITSGDHAGLVINKISVWSCWSCDKKNLSPPGPRCDHAGLVINKTALAPSARGLELTRGRAPQILKTPLHYAAGNGHLETTRALLEARADITAKLIVSEGGVGGEGQRIRESRDFGGL